MNNLRINALLTLTSVILLRDGSFGDQTVKYAVIVYRHGDRTPVECYPNDPYRNQSYWPVRFGQLTNTGKKQHYIYGKWLQQRYSNLISDHYDPKEIRVRSTDVDRTLMSAQANLAGMYKPKGSDIWNDQLMWQPIPVHTKPEEDDELLAMKKNCPQYLMEQQKYVTSQKYLERLHKYNDLMKYLTNKTGAPVKNYVDILDIYSTLRIERLYNLTLPMWTSGVFPDKMREPACYSFSLITATPLMARLSIGPFFKELVHNMFKVVYGATKLKLSVYSGHDITIGTIISALGVFDGNCPDYTSTVFFELIEDTVTSKHYVRVSYRNSPNIVEPEVLFLPNCGKLCPLERFVKLYDNLITVKWNEECVVKDMPVFMFVYTIFFVCLFVWVLKSMCASERSSGERGDGTPRGMGLLEKPC